MQRILGPLKKPMHAGERLSSPVPLPPGCYKIFAVGGAGVKDLDLALSDAAGHEVAADHTDDDTNPMIQPKGEYCVTSFQLLTVTITVKKGSGDVVGSAFRRP
jgi:hypothetical protein